MPEHVHLLVVPVTPTPNVSKLLFAIKRPFAYRVKQELLAADDPLLSELTIRQRPETTTFRFWQEGPGYDRNLTMADATLRAIDSIHANPVRRGLCSRAIDFRWSSAKWYASDCPEVDPLLPPLTSLPPHFFHAPRGNLDWH